MPTTGRPLLGTGTVKMKSLRNKADVAQRRRIAQRQLSTDFLDHALEWRRIFAEIWGTFLLVVVAAGGEVVAPRSGGAVTPHIGSRQSCYEKAIQSAVGSHDPFQKIMGTWLIRRLSPESNPIEIADLPEERDEETLLYAMGSEAANVHLGSKRQVANILRDLRRRKSNWLRSAARGMAKAMEGDWKKYRDS